jgi:hypothetical protein
VADLSKIENPLDPTQIVKAVGARRPEDLFPSDWSIEQMEVGKEELFKDGRIATGYYSKIPRQCVAGCPYDDRGECPLSVKPVGYPCPEESAFCEMLMQGYLNYIKPSADDIVSVSLIRDLVDLEIHQLRKMGQFANSSFLTEKNYFDKEGNIIASEMIESTFIGTDDKFAKRKKEILKQLSVTRADQIKNMGNSARSGEMARVAMLMERVINRLDQGEIIDCEVITDDNFPALTDAPEDE